ncbi:MAG: ABC transporter permease [Propionibacteriaceae bacterium]|nr:ABC transporter permease [Propionibacteriaceae bacterium]
MSATTALFRNEVRMFTRSPASLIWALLPMLAAVVIAAIPAARNPNPAFGGLSVSQAYTPTLTIFAISMTGLVLLPQLLGDYREMGFLRRLRTTPASAADLLKAFLALMAALCLLAALVIGLAPLPFGGAVAAAPLRYTVAVLLSTAAFLALGTVLCAVIPNPKAASGVGTAVAATQWFAAGMWFPRHLFPEWLSLLTDLLPGGAATTLMSEAMVPGAATNWLAVAVCGGWSAVGILVALKTFRWE